MDGTQKPQQEIVAAEQKQEAPSLLAIIAAAAKDPSVDPEKMSSIINVMERLEKRDAEKAFNAALAQIAAELPRVKKRGKVEYLIDKTKKDGPKEEAFKHAKMLITG